MSDHLDPADLEALALGAASDAVRARADAHLDRCPACADVLSELARLFASQVPIDASASPSWVYTATLPARPASRPPPGTTVGRYVLEAPLGEGGMGVVYRAHDPELDRAVAIKLLHPDPGVDPREHGARLRAEAQAMARLAHPNVVAVHDVGTVGDRVFVAVELVEGETLRSWLAGPRSLRELLRVFGEAGRGLAAAHGRGIVHRDFKPENVLVGADGRARVTDFGLARHVDPGPASPRGALHATHALAGTPAYMAPEQFRGEQADARTDQFAFGVALHEAALQRRPFDGATLGELAKNVLSGARARPPRQAPRWLAALLSRALAPRREDRFPSMEALLAELERDRARPARVAGLAALSAAAIAGLVTVGRAFLLEPPPSRLGQVAAPAPSADPCAAPAPFDAESRRAFVSRAATKELAGRFASDAAPWADALAAARRAACEAGAPPPVTACLEDRARTLEAYVGAAGRADARALALAVERLEPPSLDTCGAASAFPAPAKDDAAAFVARRDRLAAARVALTFGREDEAKKITDELLAAPGALDPLSLADAHALAGWWAELRGEAVAAERSFGDALAAARAARLAPEARRAAAGVIAAAGLGLLEPATEAKRLMDDAVPKDASRLVSATAALAGAELLHAVGDGTKARDALAEVLSSAADLGETPALVRARAALVDAHLRLGELPEAEAEAKRALAAAAARPGDPRSLVRATLAAIRVDVAAGRAAEGAARAEALRKATFDWVSTYDPLVAEIDVHVGLAREAEGRLPEARAAYARAASSLRAAHTDSPRAPAVDVRLVRLSLREGKDAVKEAREALARTEAAFGKDHPVIVEALRALAAARLAKKDAQGAVDELDRAIDLVNARHGFVSPLVGDLYEDLGLALTAGGNAKDALAMHDSALLPLQARYGMDHPRVTLNLVRRGDLASRLGDRAYATRMWSAALDALGRRPAPELDAAALRKKLGP